MSTPDKTNTAISSQAEENEEATSLGGRAFLPDEVIRNVVHEGRPGYMIKVCLTSYRALPLSCIEKIELKVDGQVIPPNNMRFILNGYSHKLDEFARLRHIFWFILDYADLFVESKTPLSIGEHLVEGLLVTVEPYITAGRYSFYNPSTKRLSVAIDL
ncbi:MAG TPA: DUF6379 domain-containing protein [Anaerolineales bacterium]|nr:DUF6379 domain-containing protein [Anaerolineales bacterium]